MSIISNTVALQQNGYLLLTIKINSITSHADGVEVSIRIDATDNSLIETVKRDAKVGNNCELIFNRLEQRIFRQSYCKRNVLEDLNDV